MRFEETRVLVTGGTGVLGRHVTRAFLEEGARVVASYIVEAELEETKARAGDRMDRLTLLRADLFQEEEVNDLVNGALEALGGLDVVVNVVGGYFGGVDVVDTELEEWEFMMDLNLKSVFLVCRTAVPHLLEGGGGKVVNVASSAGLEGDPGHAAYSASKAGVIRLTESLSREVKEEGVNVNCVLPNVIDTPENRESMPKANFEKWPKPSEIARVILFLASEDAKLLHGAAVPVYGLSA